MLLDAAGHLGPAHVAALVAHPEAVRSALATAADALTAGDGERRSEVETIAGHVLPTVDATEADRRLSARARDGAPERLLIALALSAASSVSVSRYRRCRRRTVTDIYRQPFESGRFRNAFASGIANCSEMATG